MTIFRQEYRYKERVTEDRERRRRRRALYSSSKEAEISRKISCERYNHHFLANGTHLVAGLETRPPVLFASAAAASLFPVALCIEIFRIYFSVNSMMLLDSGKWDGLCTVASSKKQLKGEINRKGYYK